MPHPLRNFLENLIWDFLNRSHFWHIHFSELEIGHFTTVLSQSFFILLSPHCCTLYIVIWSSVNLCCSVASHLLSVAGSIPPSRRGFVFLRTSSNTCPWPWTARGLLDDCNNTITNASCATQPFQIFAFLSSPSTPQRTKGRGYRTQHLQSCSYYSYWFVKDSISDQVAWGTIEASDQTISWTNKDTDQATWWYIMAHPQPEADPSTVIGRGCRHLHPPNRAISSASSLRRHQYSTDIVPIR